jgi:hypothetical protein
VDESDGLENRCGRKVTVGSNPTSSAQPYSSTATQLISTSASGTISSVTPTAVHAG